MKTTAACFLLLLAGAAVLHADEILLADGSRIVGTLIAADAESLRVETAFAGELTLKRDQVTAVRTDDKRMVQLGDGTVVAGRFVGGQGDTTRIQTEYGELTVPSARIADIWALDAPSPADRAVAAAAPQWKTEIRAALSGSQGNSDYSQYGAGFTSTMTTPDERLKFYGDGKYVEDGDETTAEEIVLGADFERFLAKHHSLYARVEGSRDPIQDLDLRIVAATGYGYYPIREEDHELRFRLGLQYRHEAYDPDLTRESFGLDIGAYHMLVIPKWGTLTTDVTYVPSLEDTDDYVVTHETTFDIPTRWDAWTFRIGVRNEYTNLPVNDLERLDTDYFAELVWTWE